MRGGMAARDYVGLTLVALFVVTLLAPPFLVPIVMSSTCHFICSN